MRFLNGIGLGTFPFSNVFSRVDENATKSIVNAFLDLGGNYIQTAPYYEGVDTLVGTILKPIPRDRYYICTLCVKNREGIRTGKYSSIIKQCDDSLQQLGLDYIDLYMTSTTKAGDATFDETMGALADLKKEGKIKDIGVSNVTISDLKEYNKHGQVQFVQNRFSLLNPSINDDFTAYCDQYKIGLLPYQVIERGLLTDRVLQGFTLRDGDLRQTKPEFRKEAVQTIGTWVSKHLKPLADSSGTSIEALIILWTLHQANVSLCLIGATNKEQIAHAFEALAIRNNHDILEQVAKSYQLLSEEIREKYSKSVQEFLGNVY